MSAPSIRSERRFGSHLQPKVSVASVVRRRANAALYPLLGILGAAAIVEFVSRANILPNRFFPPTSTVAQRFTEIVVTGGFWDSVLATLQGWALGLAAGVILAVPLGLLMGTSVLFYRATRPLVEFLWPIPAVALIPLALLLFGRTLETKVFLVVLTCFWPILLHTVDGAHSTEPLALKTARAFRVSSRARFWHIVLPSALPSIATGIRIGAAAALILAIVSELLVGVPGLGREILLAQQSGQPTAVYAYIFATGMLGWVLMIGLAYVERRVLRTHGEFAGRRL